MSESIDDFLRASLAQHDGVDTQVASEDDSLRGHEIGVLLGRGGMGSVFSARQHALEREVALKLIIESGEGPENVARFRREALVLGRLEHPNIVPIHELGKDAGGLHFYTMKLVKGRTLQTLLCDLRAGDAETLREYSLMGLLTVFRKVCDAMAFAHSQGVLHRDLKPENIMIGAFGEVLVMDWGVAKLMHEDDPELDVLHSAVTGIHDSVSATIHGSVMGTPQYMSPEQARGEVSELDERSDVFSLGGILYAILTLRPPAEGTMAEVLEKVKSASITSPSILTFTSRRAPTSEQIPLLHLPGGHVPEALSAVAMKALALEKAQRYPGVTALIAEIEAYQGGFATGAENAGTFKLISLMVKRHRAVTAVLVALLLASVGFVWKVMASERRAVAGEASANSATAVAERERESTRRAFAHAQILLADAAVREDDGSGARAALQLVPDDLRDANWSYLLGRSDTSLATMRSVKSGAIIGLAAHPREAGVFAFAGADHWIAIVNARTGERLLDFASGFKDLGSDYCLSFSSDGEELAVSNNRAAVIRFFSTRDGQKLREWATPPPASIEFRAGRRQLLVTPVVRGKTNELRLHDADTGSVVWAVPDPSPRIKALFLPSASAILVSTAYNTVRLVDAGTGRDIRALPSSGLFFSSFAVSPDGEFVAYGDSRGGVRCVRLRDSTITLDFRTKACAVREIFFTPDSQRLVTLSYPNDRSFQHVRVWSAVDGYPLQAILGADDRPRFAQLHPASGELIVAGGIAKSWDTTQITPQWRVGAATTRTVRFCDDDKVILVTGYEEGTVASLVQLSGKDTATTLWEGPRMNGYISSLSTDLRSFTALFHNKTCGVFRRDGGVMTQLVTWLPASPPRILRLNPVGDRVWTGSHLLDAMTGSALQPLSFKQPGKLIKAEWFAADRIVATFDEGERTHLALADTGSGETIRTVTVDSRILTLATSPGGKLVAEAGVDKVVRVRSPDTLDVRHHFRAHDASITALAFHPTEPVIATGSEDRTIRIWNYQTGAMLEEIRGIDGSPSGLDWSPGGRRLASSSTDYKVSVWEPRAFNKAPAAPPLVQATARAPAISTPAGEWRDLMAALKPGDVADAGQGWVLENGTLRGPNKHYATLAIASGFSRSSYHVQAKIRRFTPNESFSVLIPVGDSQTGVTLDGYPHLKFLSGLDYAAKKPFQPVVGLQVNDSEVHLLDVIVRHGSPDSSIEVKLDERPLFQWSGPASGLSRNARYTGLARDQIGIGTHTAEWVVQGLKVKRL